MIDYLPLALVVVIAMAFVLITVGLSLVIGPKRYSEAKHTEYESGVLPTPAPPGGGRFAVKYFIVAMLFIIFDIEVVFLYPWAKAFGQLGWFALVEMLLFIATVFVAYVYVWRRGGLEWE